MLRDTVCQANTAKELYPARRDGCKYRIWLHLMTQLLASVPSGIVDSCNNVFIVQLKTLKNRGPVMAHLVLGEKRFVDEHYKRYILRMEVAHNIVRFDYLRDKRDVQPMLAEALMVPAREPTDAEIYRHSLMQPPKKTL